MRIAIISSMMPHVNGGYRRFVDLLAPALERAAHKVEKIWLPFSGDPALMLAEMAAFRMADYDAAFDLVICTRTPAHVVRHARKVVWFIHHERIFYDLWDSEYNVIPKSRSGEALRRAFIQADNRTLREAHAVFTNSSVVADRLLKFNQIRSEVLYPPIADDFLVESMGYGSELLFNCRIEEHKRQHLAIAAMARTKTPVRLRIVGRSQSPDYVAKLRAMIVAHDLEDRVTLDDRWISEGEKCYLLGHSLACVYVPFDEDSYGYPTLEAARACRATISTYDAGGVAEFIRGRDVGFLCEADAESLASAFDALWRDRSLASSVGTAAQARMQEMEISWDRVVARLTA